MYDAVIIDGNNFAKRAFFAHKKLSVKKESGSIGTGLIYGFYEIMMTVVNSVEGHPRIFVTWDKGRNKRTKIYSGYKSGRDKKEKDPKKQKEKEESNKQFRSQLIMLQNILKITGIDQVFTPGEEADDVMGALAKNLSKQGQKVLIATGDHDLFQLINESVELFLTRPKKNSFWDVKTFYKVNGIYPHQVIDAMSLQGDEGDSIPGIKGIGEVKSVNIVKNNPDLVHDIINGRSVINIKGVNDKDKELVLNNFEAVKLANKLVTIDVDMKPLTFVKTAKDLDRLLEIFEYLEFESYMTKLNWGIISEMGR